ncbi:MAG: fructose-1,6-bisphosphatase [Candidatus Peribacteraceae bacterium]|nr:fructose-1,6-bisphosphatase [Candidatus Peribacteraceae bacterium]
MPSNSPYCPIPSRISLNAHLYRAETSDDLRHLINDVARAAKYIQFAIRTTEAGLAGTKNQFGEDQVKLDVLSDEIIRQHLCESQLVASFSSEEMEDVIELDPKAPYSVVYDPLDGSSLVDANFAIGSIFGFYEGKEIIGRRPREQVAALYVLYGPRTLLVYSVGKGVHEFILNDVGEFILLRENLGVADKAKTFSPGNIGAVTDTAPYRNMLNLWLDEKMKLRYSGAMVADIHHVISKGQGIFTNVGGAKYPEGKLRLVFECGPFAYLMEQAGGAASDGKNSILDVAIRDTDQRTPIIIGSKEEVKRVCDILSGKTR